MADLTGMLQAAAGQAGGEGAYIEDVFSTYLFNGNNSTQTITNGIDLDGEGGLVWIKHRDDGSSSRLFDTERGTLNSLQSDTSNAEVSTVNSLTSFNSNGFSLGSSTQVNNGGKIVSWTFRKAPKFFDCVTWTGNGVAGRTVSHNLGSVPGCIIVKATSIVEAWPLYHRANTANPETDYLRLNATSATVDSNLYWNDTAPTDTVFTVGTDSAVNQSGVTYVAYLFAHDAGGFGDDGAQNVISCGSYTGTGAEQFITLGWEPQFVIIRQADGADNWHMLDNMRGIASGSVDARIYANSAVGESSAFDYMSLTATGFSATAGVLYGSGANYIYIAIRRGPMKTPESGTEVFAIDTLSATPPSYTSGFPIDMAMNSTSSISSSFYNDVVSRLTGTKFLRTSSTAAESSETYYKTDFMTGWDNRGGTNSDQYSWMFRRAPGFMDVVCWTGNDVSGRNINHNLGAVPELIIVKLRTGSGSQDWAVYTAPTGNTKYMRLNGTLAATVGSAWWNNTTPTDTVFTVGNEDVVNNTGWTYVAYLFASLAGVSKVGSYTGNGTSVSVTTGFQPRFILVKRTDSTGNWIFGDSARGLVAGDDPYLLLNSNAAEDTDEDWVDVSATGFTINETAANANVNTGTYIYLAIS
jgi:hypothetical protein